MSHFKGGVPGALSLGVKRLGEWSWPLTSM